MAIEIVRSRYRLWIPHARECESEGNLDLHVFLENGPHYVCTVYTPENLRRILNDFRYSGEGSCMWDPSMVIVSDLQDETICAAVEELIATGAISRAMELAGQ